MIYFCFPARACMSRRSRTFEKLCDTFSPIHESTVTSKIIDTGQSHVINDEKEKCVCAWGGISGDLSVDTTTLGT